MNLTSKGDIVTAALRKLGVASNATLTDVEPQSLEDGVNDLEMMMAEWSGLTGAGIDAGYIFAPADTPPDAGDPHGLQNNALNAVIINLACRISPDYAIEPVAKLIASARYGKESLIKLSAIERARKSRCRDGYPNRMPVGSGNRLATSVGINYYHRRGPCDADSSTSSDEGNG